MSNKVTAVLTAIGIMVAILGTVGGGLWALESRIETKIDRAVAPIAENVQGIRDTLDKLLLKLGGP